MRFPQILLLLLLLVVELAVTAATPSTTLAKPGCPHSCGNLTIPYPFGTRQGCSLNEMFLITCECENDSKPVLPSYYTNSTVLDISLDGELRVSTWLGAYACYNKSGGLVESYNSRFSSQFPISYTKNKITVVGCDTCAYAEYSQGSGYISGCMSKCNDFYDVVAGSCSGIGCCQTLLPNDVGVLYLTVNTYNNHTDVMTFNPCGVAFLAEEGSYTFVPYDLFKNMTVDPFASPVVLDWSVLDLAIARDGELTYFSYKTCEEAQRNLSSYACGKNSICYNSTNVLGYRCNCSQGYEGNPYLPNGCQDID